MSGVDPYVANAITVLQPLVSFVIGVAIYAVFVFRFYRFLASKDIFEMDLHQFEHSRFATVRMLLHFIFYIGKYLVLFPVLAFFWFAVLTILLVFLAKQQTIDNILLVSMSVVSAIRITSYYDEDLSRDLAKILPFALLGVFLIDVSYFSVPHSLEALSQLGSNWPVVTYYLGFVIAMEFILRLGTPFFRGLMSIGKAYEH